MSTKLRAIFFLIGLAVFFYLLYDLGAGRVFAFLLEMGAGIWGLLVIYCLVQIFRAAALLLCLREFSEVSWKEALWLRLSGEAIRHLTFTGPFLAEPSKALLVTKRIGLGGSEAFAATISEYLIYTFSSALIALSAISYVYSRYSLEGAVRVVALVLVISLAVFLLTATIAIVFRIYLIGAIVEIIRRLPWLGKHIPADPAQVGRMEDFLLIILRERPARLVTVLAVQFLSQGILCLEIAWILYSMGLAFNWSFPFLIEGAVKFVSIAFFFVPTQIGAAEAVYAASFEIFDLSATAGFTVSFIRRLRNLGIAGVGLLLLWLGTRRAGKQEPPAGNRDR